MSLSNKIREELWRFYVGSYGGKYELAGRIEGIETLVQEGYLSSSRGGLFSHILLGIV